MEQTFDINAVLREVLEKVVEQSKENGLKLFKDYMPALFKQAVSSIDYWAFNSNIDISEKCIVGEVGEYFTKLFEERKNSKILSENKNELQSENAN